ncbi:DUF5324 family protein [Streptomyces sp. NPDC056144]|uniref:DUF5324 family protein n=1 Tax=unclassified Streptomyces TaxID=2593676 RepID=UPI0035E032B6
MTRMDSVRAATDSAKESVLHAAEVVAPYAESAKDQATHYAHEARVRIAPKVSRAAKKARVQARAQYKCYVAPHVPPKVDAAAHRAVDMTRSAARQATDYTVPRVEHAVAATGPVLEEAGSRSTAAWAALRGQVTPKDIEKIVKKHERRARAGRLAKGVAITGLVAGGAFAVWKWWDKQANPDWLVEPPAPTEVEDRSGASVRETEPVRDNGIGSDPSGVTDVEDIRGATEVAEADAVEPDERR